MAIVCHIPRNNRSLVDLVVFVKFCDSAILLDLFINHCESQSKNTFFAWSLNSSIDSNQTNQTTTNLKWAFAPFWTNRSAPTQPTHQPAKQPTDPDPHGHPPRFAGFNPAKSDGKLIYTTTDTDVVVSWRKVWGEKCGMGVWEPLRSEEVFFFFVVCPPNFWSLKILSVKLFFFFFGMMNF